MAFNCLGTFLLASRFGKGQGLTVAFDKPCRQESLASGSCGFLLGYVKVADFYEQRKFFTGFPFNRNPNSDPGQKKKKGPPQRPPKSFLGFGGRS